MVNETKNSAIFLDRDGTLNIDFGYVYKTEDLKFIDGVEDALELFHKAGYKLIVISNQSGIARGYFSQQDCNNFNMTMNSVLSKRGISIEEFYVCPHSPSDNCNCRKPLTKMIEDAIEKYNIDTNKSYMFGDKTSDIELGENIGIKSFLVTKEKPLLHYAKTILG